MDNENLEKNIDLILKRIKIREEQKQLSELSKIVQIIKE